MFTRLSSINLIGLLCAAFFAAGCSTPEERAKKKEMTTIRFHLESNPLGNDTTMSVPVFRQSPSIVNVQKSPFLDESALAQAGLVDMPGGGFRIALQFDRHGTFVLDNVTTAYKGKHIAVLSQFPESRWLAAPLIQNRISDGKLTFTPDANREEAERIVNGLQNVIKKQKK